MTNKNGDLIDAQGTTGSAELQATREAPKPAYVAPRVARVGNLEDLTLGAAGIINDVEGSQGG